jgi:uncharacterized protein
MRAVPLLMAAAIGLTVVAGATDAGAATGVIRRPKTFLDLKYAYTVRQKRDFTCGAAALATVLKFHYDMPVTEDMLLGMIAQRYSPQQLAQKAQLGLSLEDLIYVSEKLGFQAQAAQIAIPELEKLSGPVIIKITKNKNDHFVVLRKKTADLAYISDPIVGDVTMDNAEFKADFGGDILAVWPSYITGDYFSGLSVIRDPISVNKQLEPLEVHSWTFDNAPLLP